MTIKVVDEGSNNDVQIHPTVETSGDALITLKGSDTYVRIDENCTFSGAMITLGDSCILEMGPNCSLAALEVLASANGSIFVGAQTNFTWHTRLYIHEPSRISIGSNCLIASDTLFMTSDMHSILDRTTRVRLNPAQDIFVDDNVWIAYQAKILKGAHIGKGSIVGLGSIVTTKIPPHTLAAGQPAKVIKENVAWDFSLR